LLVVLALREETPLHRLPLSVGLQLFGGFQFVKPLEEEKIGDLFNDFERIRNSARPKRIPDAIDLVADFTGKHLLEN